MGCGSSSLKGEAPNDPNSEAPMPPAKRVQTNFSEMNFDRGAGPDRRGTMAVAPDEANRSPKVSSEAPMPHSTLTEAGAEKARQNYEDGTKLEPYKSLGETGGESTEMNTLNKNVVGNTPDIQVMGKPDNEEAAMLATSMQNTSSAVKV